MKYMGSPLTVFNKGAEIERFNDIHIEEMAKKYNEKSILMTDQNGFFVLKLPYILHCYFTTAC